MRKTTRDLTRMVKLSYLQSVQVTEEERPAEDFTSVGINYSGVASLLPKIKGEKKRASFQSILDTKFPYAPDPQKRREQDTGWTVGGSFREVHWDVVGYRIGIREIGLNGFTFAPTSSVVTQPAQSPRPLYKVMLRVDETIPSAYRATEAWIVYEVTVDEGKTWHRINPLGKPTRFTPEGTVVPRILTIGPDQPVLDQETMRIPYDGEARTARLRITFRTDTSVPDSDRLSPVLHGYQLLLYPRGGLTDPTTGDI